MFCPSLEPESSLRERARLALHPEYPTGNQKQNAAGWNQLDRASSRLLNPKGSGWRPSRLDVSKAKRVQLRPQNVAFRLQGCHDQLLLSSRAGILGHPLQGESRIFWSLVETRRKIVQSAGKPRIMLAQAIHPQRNQVSREQLGQRGSYRLQETQVT